MFHRTEILNSIRAPYIEYLAFNRYNICLNCMLMVYYGRLIYYTWTRGRQSGILKLCALQIASAVATITATVLQNNYLF